MVNFMAGVSVMGACAAFALLGAWSVLVVLGLGRGRLARAVLAGAVAAVAASVVGFAGLLCWFW